MLKSFSEYLGKNSEIILEMARVFSQPRVPVNLDADDIDFLKQFKYEDQKTAITQRYNYLFEALKSLHERRKSHTGMVDLQNNIITALSKEITNLKQNIDAKESIEFKKLYSKNTDEKIRIDKEEILSLRERIIRIVKNKGKISEEDIKEEAERIAYDHARAKIGGLPESEDERKPFRLGKSKKNPERTVFAKPYLNRLYHKLERTVGEEHINDQIKKFLGEVGKYGFDLSEPKEIQVADDETDGKKMDVKTTRGMRFPVHENNKRRINHYQQLLAHRMFGEIPNDVYWIKDESKKDTLTREHILEPKIKKFYTHLNLEPEKPKSDKERRNLAKKKADAELYKQIQAGQRVLGPKYPLRDPQTGENKGFYQGELKGQTNNLDAYDQKIEWLDPDLYLPHVKNYFCPNAKCKKFLNKDEVDQIENGKTIKCKKCQAMISRDGINNANKAKFNFTPYMKTATFYRRLKGSDFNIETDESGSVISSHLKPEVKSTNVVVSTNYPGANAQQIQNSITSPILNALEKLNNVQSTQHENFDGSSKVSILLKPGLNRSDKNSTIQEITSKIQQIKNQLPKEAEESKINVSEINKLRGIDKTWVALGDEEFKYGKEHKKGGAFDFNQNIKERQYANKLSPDYQKLLTGYLDELQQNQVVVEFGARARIKKEPPKPGDDVYFSDFAKGILDSRGRGGTNAPIWLINDRDTFHDLHQLVMLQMMSDLHNVKRWGTPAARRNAAATATGNFLQLAQPGHSESRRRRTSELKTFQNTSVLGADGKEIEVSDPTSNQSGIGKNLRARNVADFRDAKSKRGQGGRVIQFGKGGFYNDLQKLRNFYKLQAVESDKETNAAKQMSDDSIQEVEAKLTSLASSKIKQHEIEQGIIDMFVMLGVYNADSAQSQINSWKEDKYTATKMLQAFNSHPLVQEKMSLAQQNNLEPQPVQLDLPVELAEPVEMDTEKQIKPTAAQEKPNIPISQPAIVSNPAPVNLNPDIRSAFNRFKTAYESLPEELRNPEDYSSIGKKMGLKNAVDIKVLQDEINKFTGYTPKKRVANESQITKKVNLILSRSQDSQYLSEINKEEIKIIYENLLKIPESIYGLQKKKAILEISKTMRSRGII